MISYCIACYRPRYAVRLIAELVRKTSAQYEILVWLNTQEEDFEAHLRGLADAGVPLKIVGATPGNIGMAAYPDLFAASRYEMVVQIDDDVVMVSPGIAEIADRIFRRFPNVCMLTADVWQDEYTTGARPEMSHYRLYDAELGLYDGPIDGWFAVYRRSSLRHISVSRAQYLPLGGLFRQELKRRRLEGLLCMGFRVFHVIGPQYASCFGMLDFEIEKYRRLGRNEIVRWYESARAGLPDAAELEQRVAAIEKQLSVSPGVGSGGFEGRALIDYWSGRPDSN